MLGPVYDTGGQCGQLGTAKTLSSVKKIPPISLWLPGVQPSCMSSPGLWWAGRISYSIWFAHFQSFFHFHSHLMGYWICGHTWSLLSTLFANPTGYFVLLVIFPHPQLSLFMLYPPIFPSLLFLANNGGTADDDWVEQNNQLRTKTSVLSSQIFTRCWHRPQSKVIRFDEMILFYFCVISKV